MQGQFIFSTCFAAGLNVRALLRNSLRRFVDAPEALRRRGMNVALRVFEEGVIVFDDPEFAVVGLNEIGEVSRRTCVQLAPEGASAERLIVALCTLGEEREGYFPQEHQLIQRNPRTGYSSSLIYDQHPVPIPGAPVSPIILLAPKVWVSNDLNTLISFASASSSPGQGAEDVPLEVHVLGQDGEVISSSVRAKLKNSVWIVDVKELLEGRLRMSSEPRFLTVAARGGAGLYAITTFIINEAAGTFALEHSLPPQYYMDGDRSRVRREAVRFQRKQVRN
jgi:hypothetical protein